MCKVCARNYIIKYTTARFRPNFDTLTLVGVKKSQNSADFSVSD